MYRNFLYLLLFPSGRHYGESGKAVNHTMNDTSGEASFAARYGCLVAIEKVEKLEIGALVFISDLVKSLLNCDLFDGNWVTDKSYPLYKPGSCSLIDEQFNCFLNDRPDSGYLKMKWKPKACSLPRLNATHMLELLRGKLLAFVGDSLNRNMWESLICILKNSVKEQKKVYEEFGRHHFRTEASYSFIFEEYKCRVEFFVSPILVQHWEVSDKKGGKKETLRLDLIGESADKYKGADIIVFNTAHWWIHEKTSLGKGYYQEGSHVHDELNVLEAFRRALTTWGRWVDARINPKKTFVLFRRYSPTHFRKRTQSTFPKLELLPCSHCGSMIFGLAVFLISSLPRVVTQMVLLLCNIQPQKPKTQY
ncbi:Protein trichome birefringence-like 4 [Capsicum baccatum]|uniref:Protein trichome birefringence-like 4 n=1 Tax=Capsicum baccatum TaxID=33114 RepID=A0A2G2UX64_CAPBA|nr:Protein trichome birefringence-like 4 [Capsicum baccatum]